MSAEDEDVARAREACNALGEHFDTVQLFCTRHEGDGTVNVHVGVGNFFARRGQVAAWLERQNEETRLMVRDEHEEDNT